MSSSKKARLERARASLEGLSCADALGGFFEGAGFRAFEDMRLPHYIKERTLMNPPWHFTDDTNMALSIYENLRLYGEIKQDELAQSFAAHYAPTRGYGPAMHRLLARILAGADWHTEANALFSGTGSFGNGGSMRVAPVGAYFADDLNAVIENARRSCEVTHAHPEGVAGAIAVAVGAAVAWQIKQSGEKPSMTAFMQRVMAHVPESEVRSKIGVAAELRTTDPQHIAGTVGSGRGVSAQDTVPFTLWCAGTFMDDYVEAFWQTASGLGDVDTTCAIVGGIVATYGGRECVPAEWVKRREPLPEWAVGSE